jgi:hypothetical protein
MELTGAFNQGVTSEIYSATFDDEILIRQKQIQQENVQRYLNDYVGK